jgi:hypothetical protein
MSNRNSIYSYPHHPSTRPPSSNTNSIDQREPKARLHEHGWVDGKNIRFEERWGRDDELTFCSKHVVADAHAVCVARTHRSPLMLRPDGSKAAVAATVKNDSTETWAAQERKTIVCLAPNRAISAAIVGPPDLQSPN